ncbi:hypothetical protein HW555_010040 [Spodoptera exigua]|uniref:Uncharacterized protein n=1 Tax=Spodoptera exigua TaxID=7107 RepID=A0A835G824_SPOEX|nr:hypothetical protein HW555_010040 [Spodoptera exigua]
MATGRPDQPSNEPGTMPDECTRRDNPLLVPDEVGVKFDPNALYYDMSGDKHLIILNQHTFKKTIYFQNKQPSTRTGTDNDVKSLKAIFGNLGFEVIVLRDLECSDIIKNLTAIASKDHSKTSCICITILTHGDKGGEACRGANMDAGNTVALDSQSDSVLTIPTHADFLVLCSTVEDHLSYRDMYGSWMIQALCHVMEEHHEDLDLLHMITLMNRKVAYERSTYTPSNKAMNNKKQMPETRFTLTKLLKF